jgi:hypothetical protein
MREQTKQVTEQLESLDRLIQERYGDGTGPRFVFNPARKKIDVLVSLRSRVEEASHRGYLLNDILRDIAKEMGWDVSRSALSKLWSRAKKKSDRLRAAGVLPTSDVAVSPAPAVAPAFDTRPELKPAPAPAPAPAQTEPEKKPAPVVVPPPPAPAPRPLPTQPVQPVAAAEVRDFHSADEIMAAAADRVLMGPARLHVSALVDLPIEAEFVFGRRFTSDAELARILEIAERTIPNDLKHYKASGAHITASVRPNDEYLQVADYIASIGRYGLTKIQWGLDELNKLVLPSLVFSRLSEDRLEDKAFFRALHNRVLAEEEKRGVKGMVEARRVHETILFVLFMIGRERLRQLAQVGIATALFTDDGKLSESIPKKYTPDFWAKPFSNFISEIDAGDCAPSDLWEEMSTVGRACFVIDEAAGWRNGEPGMKTVMSAYQRSRDIHNYAVRPVASRLFTNGEAVFARLSEKLK